MELITAEDILIPIVSFEDRQQMGTPPATPQSVRSGPWSFQNEKGYLNALVLEQAVKVWRITTLNTLLSTAALGALFVADEAAMIACDDLARSLIIRVVPGPPKCADGRQEWTAQ